MRLFDVVVAPRGDGGTTFTLSGDLDMSTVDQLEQAVASGVNGRRELVVLDLRRLGFLDSSGLRLMLGLHGRLKQAGGRLVLIKGPRRVHRVFELTQVVEELEIVDDPDAIQAAPPRAG